MERLSPTDVSLLEVARGPIHGHVGQLLVLEPSDDPLDLAGLRDWYATRLDRTPMFRRRLVDIPLRVHRPLWVDDPSFELINHVQGISLERGDRRDLRAAVGRLLGLSLDLTKPPWEAWLIGGIDGGRVAILTKQHVSAIDNRAGDEMAVAALDTDPTADASPVDAWEPEPQPSEAERVGLGVASRLRRPRLLADAARDASRRRRIRAERAVPSVFDQPLTTRREVAFTTLALGPVKSVKDHHDVTVNDVVLAVCAGGLRRWLDERDAVPVDPLLALVPVSVAGDIDGDDADNHVAAVISSLATDTRDPALRIQVIQDATREARRRRAIGATRLRDWAHFAAPAVLGKAGRVALEAVRDSPTPPANVVIANIPGPTVPLYAAGAHVQDLFYFAPIANGLPLAITVISVGDRMDVALVGCPDTAPDVAELAGYLEDALEELVETVPMADRSTEDPIAAPTFAELATSPVLDLGQASTGGRTVDVGRSSVVDETRAALFRSRKTRERAKQVSDVLGDLSDLESSLGDESEE